MIPSVSRSQAWKLLCTCSVMGFIFAAFGEWNWQHAVEGSQVIAGVVKYPHPTPFLIYQVKTWTLLHQIPALFLRLGVSEKTLSIFLSGLSGSLSFSAVAMAALVCSGQVWFSVLVPCFVGITSMYVFGTSYPVMFMSVMMTYGVVGLSWSFLSLALHGTQSYRLGAVLLGAALSIHPALGLFAWILFFTTAWSERKYFRELFPGWGKCFLMGSSISLLSLLFYFFKAQQLLPSGLVPDEAVFRAFIRGWDGHRMGVPFLSEDVKLAALAFLTAVVWLFRASKDLPAHTRFYLKLIGWASVWSFLMMFLTWIPQDQAPMWLISIMPGRMFSFIILGFGALLTGLPARYRNNPASEIFLVIFILGMLVLTRGIPQEDFFVTILGAMITGALVQIVLRASNVMRAQVSGTHQRIMKILRAGSWAGLLMCASVFVIHVARVWPHRFEDMQDRTNHPVYAEIAKGKGLLLIQYNFGTTQLLTRRPLLIDIGAMDGMAYTPDACRSTYEILKDVYGIDLMTPMDGEMVHYDLWTSFTREDWQRLSAKHHFTDVLVISDWKLQLPLIIDHDGMAYYHVPQPEETYGV